MSLVNEMLQDLQQRRAPDSKPLTGLRAVPAGPRAVAPAQSKPANRWWIAVATVMTALTIVFEWVGITSDSTDSTDPAGITAVNAVSPPVTQPQGIATGPVDLAVDTADHITLASLKTNQMDYFLKSPPPPGLRAPVPVKTQTVLPAAQPSQTVSSVETTPAIVAKTGVSRVEQLRHDGLAALRAGRPIVAERHFVELAAADPADPESHLFLHAALNAQSRTAAARTALLSGLKFTSEPARLAQVLAYELLAEDRVNHALSILTTHRPTGVVDLAYDARLAAANQRAGHHDVAVQIYHQLLGQQPANGTWWVGLAISQEATGQSVAAARSFARATAAGTLDATLARYAAQRLEKLEAAGS